MFIINITLLSIAALIRTCVKILTPHENPKAAFSQLNYYWSLFTTILATCINAISFAPRVSNILGWLFCICISLLVEIMTVVILNKIYPNATDREVFAQRIINK